MSRHDYTGEVFTSRAVSETVAKAREYRRYEKGDRATVLDVDPRLAENPDWLRRVLRAPGWAIPKIALMPDHPDFGWRPYAQLRPDWPVMAKWYGHDHGGMLHRGKDDPKLQRRRGRNRGRCYCGLVHKQPPIRRGVDAGTVTPEPGESFWDAYERGFEVTREWYQAPIKDRREHEASVCDAATVPEAMEPKVAIWRDGELVRDRKGRVVVPTGHLHPDTGEVIVPLDRPHKHLDWAKYVYVKGRGKAQRLNTHSWVREAGYEAPEGLFVFVIEGTLKLDSAVSAGWPGIEAGSVTLWNAEVWDELALPPPEEADNDAYVRHVRELEEFAARHLQGVRTAVVCDSDWAENWLVRAQVDAAVEILAGCGVPAVGCAPPPGRELGWTDPATGYPKQAKNGLDDWLESKAEDDRHDALLDLIVREPGEDDAPGLETAVERASGRRDGRENVRTVLRDFGRRATDSGVLPYRPDDIATSTRLGHTTVDRWRNRLIHTGAVSVIGEAEHRLGDGGGWTTLPPRLLLSPDLVPPARRRTLRDWRGR